jgi:prolipoprotein diacylglyceryltransferase
MVSAASHGRDLAGDTGSVGQPTPSVDGYTAPTVPIAALALDFDPILRLGDGAGVRWSTLAVATIVAIALVAAARRTRRAGLRADDLLYLAVGAVPGAVVGGRLGYALLVPEAFAGGPLTLADPAIGGLELGLGVVGGIASAGIVALLLGAPPAAWAHRLSLILLAVLAGGKFAMVLDGSGQGALADVPWATAYLGSGPWGSTAAELPSHPAQAYEAVGIAVVLGLLAIATAAGAFRARDGSRLAVALAGWAAVRVLVSTTWRDPAVLGPVPMGGVLAVLIAIGAALAVVAIVAWWPRRSRALAAAAEPSWPDPEDRPRF